MKLRATEHSSPYTTTEKKKHHHCK